MRTKITSSLLAVAIVFSSLFVFSIGLVHARNRSENSLMNTTEKDTTKDEIKTAEEAQIVNSFELFWPLVAGKTEDTSFYFLKLIKEQVLGWFISGDSKKADYAVLLGTKRALEAEKLLKDGKNDLALKTLEKAKSQFSSAYSYVKKADSERKLSTGEIRRDRLIHVKSLIDSLKTVTPEEVRPGLDAVKESADAILRDYLP